MVRASTRTSTSREGHHEQAAVDAPCHRAHTHPTTPQRACDATGATCGVLSHTHHAVRRQSHTRCAKARSLVLAMSTAASHHPTPRVVAAVAEAFAARARATGGGGCSAHLAGSQSTRRAAAAPTRLLPRPSLWTGWGPIGGRARARARGSGSGSGFSERHNVIALSSSSRRALRPSQRSIRGAVHRVTLGTARLHRCAVPSGSAAVAHSRQSTNVHSIHCSSAETPPPPSTLSYLSVPFRVDRESGSRRHRFRHNSGSHHPVPTKKTPLSRSASSKTKSHRLLLLQRFLVCGERTGKQARARGLGLGARARGFPERHNVRHNAS
jgi:hypothetical protein